MQGAAGRVVVVAALCAAVLTACTGAPPPEPSARARTAEPTPTAVAQAAPAPAVPFDLVVDHITVVGMSNAEILGTPEPPPNGDAAVVAVTGARDALAAFLNAQFVTEATRFSAGPIDALLSPRARGALKDEDRAGLGHVALPLGRTVTGPASAQAHVLLLGDQVDAVTLDYTALLTVVLSDGNSAPAAVSGSMTFVPTPEGWRADAVEATADLPEVSS